MRCCTKPPRLSSSAAYFRSVSSQRCPSWAVLREPSPFDGGSSNLLMAAAALTCNASSSAPAALLKPITVTSATPALSVGASRCLLRPAPLQLLCALCCASPPACCSAPLPAGGPPFTQTIATVRSKMTFMYAHRLNSWFQELSHFASIHTRRMLSSTRSCACLPRIICSSY